MKCAYYERTGPAAEVLTAGELPEPHPGPGEVRVRVRVSGVNPSDVKSRRGATARPMAFPRVVPHSDGSGEIDAVGDGVDRGRVGERVWLRNAQWQRPFGTAAQWTVVPQQYAHPLPPGVDDATGACLGIPLLTAHRAVFYDGDIAGATVLVQGGAGAVGHYAVQLAARAGARVIATVSSGEKAAIARAAGADATIDYKRDDLRERVAELTGGRGVDRIIEVNLSANAGTYAAILARDGRAVVYGSDDWNAPLPLGTWLVHGVQLAFFIVYELGGEPLEHALRDTDAALRSGWLQHRIGAQFPLADIVRAHKAVESGTIVGNVVVTLP